MIKEFFSPDKLRFYARWQPMTFSFNNEEAPQPDALLVITVENKSAYDLRDFTAIVVRQPKSYIGRAFNELKPLAFFDAPPVERYLLRAPFISAKNALTDCPRMIIDTKTTVLATMKFDEPDFLWVVPSRVSFVLPSEAPYIETRGNPAWFSRNIPPAAKVPPQEVAAFYRPSQMGLFTFNFPAP